MGQNEVMRKEGRLCHAIIGKEKGDQKDEGEARRIKDSESEGQVQCVEVYCFVTNAFITITTIITMLSNFHCSLVWYLRCLLGSLFLFCFTSKLVQLNVKVMIRTVHKSRKKLHSKKL